eukprot:2492874-Rhodomonas_salina.1
MGGDQRIAPSRVQTSRRAPVHNSVPAAVNLCSPSPASIAQPDCRAGGLGGDYQRTFQSPVSCVCLLYTSPSPRDRG